MRGLIDTAGTRVQLIATTNKAFRSFVNDQFYFPDELILSVKYLEKNNPLFIIGSQQSSYRITFFWDYDQYVIFVLRQYLLQEFILFYKKSFSYMDFVLTWNLALDHNRVGFLDVFQENVSWACYRTELFVLFRPKQ